MKRIHSIVVACAVIAILLGACASPLGHMESPKGSAELKMLTITNAEIEPVISADTVEYEVYSSADSVSVSGQAVEPGATVAYDTPDPNAIVLGDARTDVRVTVTSADRITSKTYCVRIYHTKATATVRTLDSVNGSLLPAEDLTYRVYRFGKLVGHLKAKSNPQDISLIPGVSFRLEAVSKGRAESALEDVVAKSEGSEYTFFCQKSGMSSFPASAPTVKNLQTTMAADPALASEAEWTELPAGGDLNLETVTGFRVIAKGACEMDATSWSGTGVKMDFDNMPTVFNGLEPIASTSSFSTATGLFTTCAVFDFAGNQMVTGSHYIDIVAYDRANNRVEKIVPVNVVSVPVIGGDLSGAVFSNISADMRTYGVSREYFSLAGARQASVAPAPSGVSYRIAVTFRLRDASAVALPILGFKVLRSSDGGASYVETGRVNYGYQNSAAAHSFFGSSSDWTIGAPYVCKIVAFTDGTHETESAPFNVTLLPTFTASLVAPMDGKRAVEFDAASWTGPDFSFSLSALGSWDAAVSDYFYFAPAIKDKVGQYAYYGEFRYAIASGSLQFKYGSGYYDVVESFGGALEDYMTVSNGIVTLKSILFFIGYTNIVNYNSVNLDSGVTYEWDIFGSWTTSAGSLGSPSGMVPCFFQKTSAGCLSRSYADAYQNGNQTLNGWFEFTVQ